MRTIMEGNSDVTSAIDDAQERWQRANDAWETVTWALSRDPTMGDPIVEGGHIRSFVFEGSWVHELPTIYVLYEITKTQIVIQDVLFSDATMNAGSA